MELDLARHIIRTAFRAAGELGTLLLMLKQYLSEEEYQRYAKEIAAAIDAVNVALLNTPLLLSRNSRMKWRRASRSMIDSCSA